MVGSHHRCCGIWRHVVLYLKYIDTANKYIDNVALYTYAVWGQYRKLCKLGNFELTNHTRSLPSIFKENVEFCSTMTLTTSVAPVQMEIIDDIWANDLVH